ncbi:MAG: MFS transporter [Candidatus Omnitrophica bacterium]|nr:MFS transporter [Candidatus Omnitrophota bacterium]
MWNFISDRKSNDFFRFWFAQLITQFGDRVFQMALVALITALYPGSVMAMSIVFLFAIVPAFIIGPIAGVYIDRWDRRTVLFISYFIQGVLVLLAAFYLIHLPVIWPMYAVVFIISSLGRFYIPAKMAFIPEIVRKDDLHVANSLSTITGMIAGGLGVLLGSWIVERTGYFAGFCWDGICYVFSAALVMTITALHHRLPDRQAIITRTREIIQVEKSVWHEISDGIRYIRSQPEIKFMFWMMAILLAAVGAIYVVIIVFIQQAFHSVTKDLGILAVSLVVGSFLGSLAYGKWGKKIASEVVMFWSLILGGALTILFVTTVDATHSRWAALGLSFILGFVVGPDMVAPFALINKICAMEMSGKVFAALEFVVYLAFLLAMMVSSVLSWYIPRIWILIAVGGIFMVVGFIGLARNKGRAALQGTLR